MNKKRSLSIIICTGLLIFGLAFAQIILKDKDYSDSERRALAGAPALNADKVLSGKWMSDFEDYLLDQFPLRDTFRSLKAYTMKYVLGQKDNHGVYLYDGYMSKLDYSINQKGLMSNLKKFNDVYNMYLKDSDANIYLSIIPDKNYFLAPLAGYPTIDYGGLNKSVILNMPYAKYIDIYGDLALEDYYNTDQHWRQEKIEKVVKTLSENMNFETSSKYDSKVLEDIEFYGAYVGQSGLKIEPDVITYLSNKTIDECTVTSYDKGSGVSIKMYNLEKANGKDAYDFFLGGPDALIVIENPNAKSDKELVIFRDSFGSSITPMLVEGYSKVTMVDLRYINVMMLSQFVEFENCDVLFLYSTLVLNS